MGFHFATGFPTEGTEYDDPQVLVYYTNGSYNPNPGELHDDEHDDDLILGAVEYIFPGEPDPLPNLFADEDSNRNLKVTEEEGWHTHKEDLDGDGEVDLVFTALHAWVHRGNPAGVFHNTNPNVD